MLQLQLMLKTRDDEKVVDEGESSDEEIPALDMGVPILSLN